MFSRSRLAGLLPLLSIFTALSNAQSQPEKSARGTLRFTYETNITRVTFDHGPVQLGDDDFISDLAEFMQSIQPNVANPPPKVVIFDSADPDIFLHHIDVRKFLDLQNEGAFFSKLSGIVEYLRNTTTTAFITEINGLAHGLGNEFMIQTDLRYAGPKTRASQYENMAGSLAGGGGLQALPRLINRSRGLQYLLAGEAVTGKRGAELGWFNEYYETEEELKEAVNKVARRIALFPTSSLENTKAGLAELYPPAPVFQRDVDAALEAIQNSPEILGLVRKFLELGENQTRNEFELGLPDSALRLYE